MYSIKVDKFIKVNKYYLCIGTVAMDTSKRVAYKAGEIYYSREEGCLTDEQGNIRHSLSDDYAKKHFIEINDVIKKFCEKRIQIANAKL